jgi:hypothetical protein
MTFSTHLAKAQQKTLTSLLQNSPHLPQRTGVSCRYERESSFLLLKGWEALLERLAVLVRRVFGEAEDRRGRLA